MLYDGLDVCAQHYNVWFCIGDNVNLLFDVMIDAHFDKWHSGLQVVPGNTWCKS